MVAKSCSKSGAKLNNLEDSPATLATSATQRHQRKDFTVSKYSIAIGILLPMLVTFVYLWLLYTFLDWFWTKRLSLVCCALLVSCGSGGSGDANADPSLPSTRTVCVAQGSEDLVPHVIQAVDVWNDRDTRPLSETCTAFVRCLPKAVTHEIGHALGILWHTNSGLMHAGSVRSDTPGLTADDFAALPESTPTLLYVDEEQPCDHEVAWGLPGESVHAWEVAWYEISTRKIWIDPSRAWRD